MPGGRGSFGSPRSAAAPVSMRGRRDISSAVYLNNLLRFIPSCSSSSSEFLRSHSRSRPFGREHSCQGSVPLHDITGAASTCSRVSKSSIRSARRCSQPHGGFLRAPAPGLVSSQSRVQGPRSSRGFPSPRSEPFLFGRLCPLAVMTPAAHQDESWLPRPATSASRPCSAPELAHHEVGS
jgi:hypothetical protein